MATCGSAATDARRWSVRHTRRLLRDVAMLEQDLKVFSKLLDGRKGPWAEEARRLAKSAAGIAQLAAYLDGLNEFNDLMTEEER